MGFDTVRDEGVKVIKHSIEAVPLQGKLHVQRFPHAAQAGRRIDPHVGVFGGDVGHEALSDFVDERRCFHVPQLLSSRGSLMSMCMVRNESILSRFLPIFLSGTAPKDGS